MSPPLFSRISDYVVWYAAQAPKAEAVVCGDERLTYADLNRRVQEMAAALLASGIQPGDRVATLAPPSPDYLVSFLASASIGAIWVGLNPRYQSSELSYVIADSQPRIILARSKIGGRSYTDFLTATLEDTEVETVVYLDEASADVGASVEAFLSKADEVPSERLNDVQSDGGGREACMIVYTSGSTGKPKGALLHHEGMTLFALAQNRFWPVNPLKMLNYFPINHVACVVDVSLPCIVAGGTIVFMEQFDADESLTLMEREQVTLWGSVPSVLQMQLDELEKAPRDLSHVQMIAWGGAKIPQELLRRLMAFNVPLATNYGMTESSSAITATPQTRDVELLQNSVGWPFEATEIRLLGPDGRDVPDGDAGELVTRSPYTMLGYWQRPEATAGTLSDTGWMKTGDIARRDADGRYSIVGRAKEMYKSGGYNVYPKEVEQVLESHADVIAAAIVAVCDPVWQEVGVAYLETGNGEVPDGILDFCRSRLANYKIPKAFLAMTALPLLPIGKIDKPTLRARAQGDYDLQIGAS